MNKNNKSLFLIITLIFLILGLSTLSATDASDDTDITTTHPIATDSISTSIDAQDTVTSYPEINKDNSIIEKDYIKQEKESTANAIDYTDLKDKITDSTYADEELVINLDNSNNYDITESISWGSSDTTKTLTINGNGATIDGTNNQQFLTINEGYTVNLNNLIIQNTVADNGAAVKNYGTLNINNVTFKDNSAAKKGGAIYSEGTLNVIGNSHFTGNRITNGVNGDGGAAIYTNSAIYVKDTEFDSNIAEYTDSSSSSNGGNGGAIVISESISDMIIIDSTFTNNKGRHGGAILIHDLEGRNLGTKKITGASFKGNQAIYGGAIEVYNDLVIEDSVFEENFVYGVGSSNYSPRGGAICVNNLTQTGIFSLKIKNTTFERNTAPQTSISGSTMVGYGGAIDNSASETLIDNCTFKDNSANKGGAYYCSDNNRSRTIHATITNSTFKSNIAYDGAAIYDQHNGNVGTDSLTIDNSIFEDNIPTSTAYYGISLNYDDLTITNTEINGVRPIKVAASGTRSSKYAENVTINGLHNVTSIYTVSPIVSPTNYPELVIVSEEINNKYTGTETVYISLAGSEYIETEPIMFENNTCKVIFYGNYKTIDANGQQFLTVSNGKSVTINNMTIANAKAEKGAAIVNYGTLTTQSKVIFDNNEALYYGGAIYSTGNLSVSTTNFTNNKVTTTQRAGSNDYGGAAICSLGKLTVSKSNFVENVAAHNDVEPRGDGGCGGAINILNTTQAVSITTSNFTKNGARHGGAILINNNDKVNTQKVTIDKNNFDENTALYGGAIDTYQQVNITNNNFTKNTVKGQDSGGRTSMGGAIVLNTGNGPYTAIVSNNTFKENEAQEGGISGVIHTQPDTTLISSYNKYMDNSAEDTGVVTVYNATFTNDVFNGNSATYTGVFTNYGELTITDCTFENNDGNGYGDIVYAFDDVTITGSTINSDDLEALIVARDSEIIATENIVNGETLPERLIKTSLTITPETGLLVDEDNIISAALIDSTNVPVTGKEVNVVINGEVVGTNLTDENGVVSYNYVPTEGTSATIKFTFTPDDYYIASESEEIEVDLIVREETVIEYEVVNDIEGKVVLDIRVYEKTTEDLILNAKIDLSGDVTATNVRTNKLYKNTELEAGEHTITATYNGLENVYKPSTTEITFTVQKDPEKIIEELQEQLDALNETFNQTVEDLQDQLDEANDKIEELTQNLSDANGKIDELEGNVTDLNDALDDANGKISELEGNVTDLSDALDDANGKIDELEDNISDMNDTINDLIELISDLSSIKNTKITIDSLEDVKYNDVIVISGTLATEDDLSLSNQVVTITIDGKSDSVAVINGAFEYTTQIKSMGEKTVTVTYEGSEKYNSSEASIVFDVAKQDVVITVDSVEDVMLNENVTITGTFTDANGAILSKSTVHVTYNGVTTRVVTDENGVFTYTAKANPVGENEVTFAYGGYEKFNPYETTVTFNVLKRDAIITIDPIKDAVYKDTVTITGTFKDANGKALGKSTLQVTINGRTSIVKTDENGVFTITTAGSKTGINNVTIAYEGYDKYNAVESNATFIVNKKDVKVSVSEITVNGTRLYINGIFTDVDGNILTNSKVMVTLNGKLTYVLTDDEGRYFFNGYAPEGENTFTVGYYGTNNYNAYTSVPTTITVSKS